MRPTQAAVFLVLVGLAGCWTMRSPAPPVAPEDQRASAPDAPEEVVFLDVALVESGYGDRFLEKGLWDLADEQGIGMDDKPILDANGLRVCQLGGMPPPGLHRLLS